MLAKMTKNADKGFKVRNVYVYGWIDPKASIRQSLCCLGWEKWGKGVVSEEMALGNAHFKELNELTKLKKFPWDEDLDAYYCLKKGQNKFFLRNEKYL